MSEEVVSVADKLRNVAMVFDPTIVDPEMGVAHSGQAQEVTFTILRHAADVLDDIAQYVRFDPYPVECARLEENGPDMSRVYETIRTHNEAIRKILERKETT